MAFVRVENVVKSFNQIKALNGISLEFLAGEQYAIRGASGSGKSTLLYLLGGLDTPTSGNVFVAEKNLAQLNDQQLAQYRNTSVGFVFQFHFLLPSMNCLDNIFLPAKIGGNYSFQLKEAVDNLASTLGVEHCLKKFPYQLSGGEQQRINIIRALIQKPKLLLCDEPTGNLDSENSALVIDLLISLAKQNTATLIVVTHDSQVATKFPHQILLRDGKRL